MLKTELSLADVFDFFKKHQIQTFDQEIDQFGGYFITASIIAGIIISPDPLTRIAAFTSGVGISSFRVSTLLSWLPDKFKYKDKGRDMIAIKRYELSSYINFVLLQIAIKNGVKDIIMPHLEVILQDILFDEEQKTEFVKQCTVLDGERENLSIPASIAFSSDSLAIQAFKVIDPMLSLLYKAIDKCKDNNSGNKKLDSTKIKDKYLENITLQYQAFLIHCSSEFPEFALWVDLSLKAKIIKELKSATKKITTQNKKEHNGFINRIEKLTTLIEELKDKSFIAESGFPTFLHSYKRLFKIQEEFLLKLTHSKILDNINAHQTEIKKELLKPLSDNTDVEDIVYPRNKDIYIAQSFEAISYKRKEHRKGFLTANSLGDQAEKGENIGNYLLRCLADPTYIHRPIILLGNPGAGKSMLSKMFAALLCETTDYIPFLIKLRTVASSSTSISEHINKGLANSIENTSEINWLDWAKEFKDRMPVVIMDGFDELMQTSNRELNGYVDAIREFQEKAISNNVCVRIILTSRITVMQDVAISDGTKIIKLDSFDDKRRNLWIKKWNSVQTKPKHKFFIPNNEKILLLAKEPLLMFMLAVYDFEKSELQNMVNDKTFNQSKLYDSLLNKFVTRQLEKDDRYRNTSVQNQVKEDEIFRLRLGMIALMMFMNDTTSRDTQKLQDEMLAFGIQSSSYQTDNIVGGFFFIHENKSITDSNVEKFNYEFLHKTFGEFLTADFLLRIAIKQYARVMDNNHEIISKKETFQFSFGYNWLHKHDNILNFLFEHGKQIVKPNTLEHKFVINSIIKSDLKELFEKMHLSFPVPDIRLLEKKSIIEHLSIYSQNLIFLWIAIVEDDAVVAFELFENTQDKPELIAEPKYEFQDREETDRNKAHWKRIARLWTITGNHKAAARLKQWMQVSDTPFHITIKRKKSEIAHNFSDAASVSCNDFEWLLSYFDNEYKLSPDVDFLQRVNFILVNKPELSTLAIDAILHRFTDIYSIAGSELLNFINKREISRRQQVTYIRKIGQLRAQFNPFDIEHIFLDRSNDILPILYENPLAAIEFMKILTELKPISISMVLPIERLEEIFHRISRELSYISSENPFVALDYLKILNKFNNSFSIRLRFRSEFFEETMYRLSKDIHRFLHKAPHMSYEYLKLLNEFRDYYPINKGINPRIYEEIIDRIPLELSYSFAESPSVILEYLKLIFNLRSQPGLKNRRFEELISRALEALSNQLNESIKGEHYVGYEYLKVLSEIDRVVPIKNSINRKQLEYLISRLMEDIIFIIRDNPQDGLKYIKLIKQFKEFVPYERVPNEVLTELKDRIERYIRGDQINFRSVVFLYLELYLVLCTPFSMEPALETIDRLIGKITSITLSQSVFLKISALLLQYKIPDELIVRLFSAHSALSKLFSESPSLAKQVILAQIEIVDNEIFS